MAQRKCPICRDSYDDGGDSWKKICYKCYKEMRFLHGIGEKSKPFKLGLIGGKVLLIKKSVHYTMLV